MIRIRKGVVKSVAGSGGALELRVAIDGVESGAIAYPALTGEVEPGDEVRLNTTAVSLGLGSGGSHFVMAVISRETETEAAGPGHIMKMNYTPVQVKVLSVEEEDSPHHAELENAVDVGGMPVLAGSVHSMVAPVCASLRVLMGDGARIAYVMTDAACLPGAFSRTVRTLKEKGIIDLFITCGHAFGGDYEAVNIFSALAAARHALKADVVVAAMGVGVIGTGTALGHGGMEQGEIVNAAAALGGAPVFIPRIGFADARERHRGISHHTVAAACIAARARCVFPLPALAGPQGEALREQAASSGISKKHDVREFDGEIAIEAMSRFGLDVKVMGRVVDRDREFFLGCGAAANAAKEAAGA